MKLTKKQRSGIKNIKIQIYIYNKGSVFIQVFQSPCTWVDEGVP